MFGGIPKSELAELSGVWETFPNLWPALFADSGTPYVNLATDNVKQAIVSNTDVQKYFDSFNAAFEGFGAYLHERIIERMETLSIAKEENVLASEIFSRLAKISLVDKYKAYQTLSDEWAKTATDLEIIQTEGFPSVKVVDPNMVMKKKGDTEVEVQDGWVGRIIPFELVQSTLLKAESDALAEKEGKLAEISAAIAEIFESLTNEDKEDYKEAFNDDGDYIKTAVVSTAKKLKATRPAEDTIEGKLVLANDLFAEETSLKKAVKTESAALHNLTKETIEGLSDEQALVLLDLKWIRPIVTAVNELPPEVVNNFTAKIVALAEKYATTYVEVTNKINHAKNEVASLIDNLRGNEFDMKGLEELQSLLRGSKHE
jgi:type I restriction enzyme M protein